MAKVSRRIVIESTWSEVYKFKVQKNVWWMFGKMEPMELPAHYFSWIDRMDFDGIKQRLIELLNQVVEEETKPTQDTIEDIKQPLSINSRRLYACFGVIIFSLIWLFYMKWPTVQASDVDEIREQMTEQKKVELLEIQIVDKRKEREVVYQTCQASCNAERIIYDWEVTKMKWEKDLIQQKIKSDGIVKTQE